MILSRLVRHSFSSYIKSSQMRLLGLPRRYCTEVEENTYLRLTNETLESISDKFNELIEDHEMLAGGDTTLSDGVLTVKLSQFGIYVLNKQTPNKQIWLSSPVSGPYRYDISQVEWSPVLNCPTNPLCAGGLALQTHRRDSSHLAGQGA